MKTISLSKELSKNLAFRKDAEKLRLQLETLSEPIILDFYEVQVMSHSFADELFGKLAEKFGLDIFREKIIIKNINSNDRDMARAVIQGRIPDKAS